MLIRSQDKKVLCQLSNIEIVERYKRTKDGEKVTTGYAVYIFGERDTEIFMAEYSTAEKAVKVLDMIEDAYNKCFAFTMGNDGYYHEVRESKVFQMPQDEEVEV